MLNLRKMIFMALSSKSGKAEKKGYVPLCDVVVSERDDRNFWPVREYVIWFANRS